MTSELLGAAGGLGLFLLGMMLMTEGLRALAGEALTRALARFTHSPVSGVATGAISTAVVQSSSATTVAAVGFVGAGLLTFPQALGVVFGANIGTTITGWMVALLGFKLDLGLVFLPLVLVGALLRLFGRGRLSGVGQALTGFALVFVGIGFLQQGLAGLEGVVTPRSFPADDLVGRLELVGIGVLVTLVTQSSSAGVATAIAAVHAGTIAFPQAAAMVIGMDVGTTFTALLATVGGSTQARRTGAAHVIYNLMTAVMAFALLTPYARGLEALAKDVLRSEPELALVGFHTAFNTLGVLLVLPFTRPFARLIERVVRSRGPELTERLDDSLLKEEAVALEAAHGALAAVFREFCRVVGGVVTGEHSHQWARLRLDALAAAMGDVRRYLDRIRSSADGAAGLARHQALMHAADHLGRAVERCRRRPFSEELEREGKLNDLAEELAAALVAVPAEPRAEDEERLRALHARLEHEDESYRDAVVAAAATDAVETQQALERMDEMRRLRRIAHHAWRIVHHLRRSRLVVEAPREARAASAAEPAEPVGLGPEHVE